MVFVGTVFVAFLAFAILRGDIMVRAVSSSALAITVVFVRPYQLVSNASAHQATLVIYVR
jgi:hypothetical protein